MPIRRKVKELSPSLERRLASYTLAGAAALATFSSRSAMAAIVYTSVMEKGEAVGCCGGVHALIDLNQDGQADFEIIGSYFELGTPSSARPFIYAEVSAQAAGQNQIAIISGEAQALSVRQEIGPNLMFGNGTPQGGLDLAFNFTFDSNYENSHAGQFFNQRNKFLGLKLSLGGKVYYGWARVSTQLVDNNKLSFELVDYAYQSTPNLPILAGQGIPETSTAPLDFTAAPATINRYPAALGLLAHGHQAIAAWRCNSALTSRSQEGN